MKERPSGDGFLYYFLHADGYQEPLGRDFKIACEAWQNLYAPSGKSSPSSFTVVSEAFEKSDHFKSLAPKTQRDYGNGLKRLRLVFKHAPLETIRQKAIRKMRRAMVGTKTQFDRFRSVISTLYWWAIDDQELVECDNPTVGVSPYNQKGKRVKVTGAMYFAVYDEGPAALQDWMDLDLIVGQRVSDTLKLTKADIDGGKLLAAHSKAGGVVELDIELDLESVLQRILARKRTISSVFLVADESGQPLTYWRLRTMFDDAQAKAKKKWEDAGGTWVTWQRKDLRTKNATDADTLEQAQERLAHTDARTTRAHYRMGLKAKPNRLPRR